MSTKEAAGIESLMVNVTLEIHVKASLDATFAALLEQLGPGNDTPDGRPMPMKLEPWPGGRWFRDLGDNKGHMWAHVQAIKPPALLEFYGPLFMSYPVISNMQYRLTEEKGGTLIKFHHKAMGVIPAEDQKGMAEGWTHVLNSARKHAEAGRPR